MTALALNPVGECLEFLKWVSERNTHVSISLLEFLVDTLPYIPVDDDFSEDDDDDEDGWD